MGRFPGATQKRSFLDPRRLAARPALSLLLSLKLSWTCFSGLLHSAAHSPHIPTGRGRNPARLPTSASAPWPLGSASSLTSAAPALAKSSTSASYSVPAPLCNPSAPLHLKRHLSEPLTHATREQTQTSRVRLSWREMQWQQCRSGRGTRRSPSSVASSSKI